MPLAWIDGTTVSGAAGGELRDENREKGVPAMAGIEKTVKTKERLYDVNIYGIRFLAYSAGAEVPIGELERLTSKTHRARLAGESVAAELEVEDLTKRLYARAKELGLTVRRNATAGELEIAIEKAEQAAAGAAAEQLEALRQRAAELEVDDIDELDAEGLKAAITEAEDAGGSVEVAVVTRPNGEGLEVPVRRDGGKVYVVDEETDVEFESGEGHPEHHGDADLLACLPGEELLEVAREVLGNEDPAIEQGFGDAKGDALAIGKWMLAERIVLAKTNAKPAGTSSAKALVDGKLAGADMKKPAKKAGKAGGGKG